MRLLNRSRRISHLIFRLQFQEYDRNLSIMLRAGAAIKDDMRLLLALHLRLPKPALWTCFKGGEKGDGKRDPLATFQPQTHLAMIV